MMKAAETGTLGITHLTKGRSDGTLATGTQGADDEDEGFLPGGLGKDWLESDQNSYNLIR
jgi:hypothetical protein